LPATQAVQQPDSADLTLEPAWAEIGLFYGGVDLRITSEVDTGLEIAVLMTGPGGDLHFGKKEKAWGMFWAPTGNVTFEDIPGLYQLRTTVELDALAPDSVLTELGIGYGTLRTHVENGADTDLLPDLVRLKEDEGLFSYAADGINLSDGSAANRQAIALSLPVPANAPLAVYTVQLFGFRDGQLVAVRQGTFELRQTAVTHFLTSLAQRHGLLYGVIAVILAVGAGLLVGLVFGSGKKAH